MGFIYVRDEMTQQLEPPFLDNHAATWISRDEYHVRSDAQRFENWECNVAAKIAMGVAVDYALDWGLDVIEARVTMLADMLRQRLASIDGVRVRDRGGRQCGIVSFTAVNTAPVDVVRGLAERGISARVSRMTSTRLDMQARGLDALVRAGAHYYNSEEEVERFATALEEVIRA
jgi:selenocysteine lyase/cysteine desulfurase